MREEYDFSNAKRAHEMPHLARLQAEQGGKTRITIRVDNDTLAIFKARAEMSGGNYQTLINEALRQFAQGLTLSDVVRETIRQELRRESPPEPPPPGSSRQEPGRAWRPPSRCATTR